jgi:cysteine desulfurase family protein (TIGR01976 family)
MKAQLSESQLRALREQFPGLRREVAGRPAVFFDGPAGTQVPQRVIDAVSAYLANSNANHGGLFATSRESDAMLDEAHRAAADFLGADDPACIAFGPNMTTLTFALSRALARMWRPGDEVVVTRLEHDANFTPWVLAARDAGATVRCVDIHPADCTLDLDDFHRKINGRTKLVAVGCASNAVGTINPVKQICGWARQAGALTFIDAVHYAPHALIDVQEWGCDFLACSAYKFYGPHIGTLYGRRELFAAIEPYKLRPAPDDLPGRWMTGTQNHECIAGTLAAIDYLADVGRMAAGEGALARRDALRRAFSAIGDYEQSLAATLIAGLSEIDGVRVWGITDPARLDERMPTVAITHPRFTSVELATALGERGIFVWHGNYYALPLTEALGVEPEGMVRIGLVHYNTREEITRLLQALREIVDLHPTKPRI